MVNSGSSANLLALASFNFKKGSEIIDNANINDINKKIVGSLIYNSKINNDIFGFGLAKIEYIKKPLELFCKDIRLSILN